MSLNISSPTVGVFSDIHIGNYRDNVGWHEIVESLAHWIKDEYASRGIKDIIIPGDVFHNRFEIGVQTLNAAAKFFDILSEFNIIITIGNHDAYYRDRSDLNSLALFDKWPNITIVDQLTIVKWFDATVSLCPWAVDTKEIPSCDIVFGHFEFNGFHVAHSKICTFGEDGGKLTSRAPLILTGHFHQHAERKYSGGKIVYLGTPYQLNWGEAGDDKYIFVVDIEQGEILEKIANKITPTHNKVRYSQWIEQDKTIDCDALKGNFVTAIVDSDAKTTTDTSVEQFLAVVTACHPREFRVQYLSIDEQLAIDTEFDGVDIPQSIREFIDYLDYPPHIREQVYHQTKTLYDLHCK